MDILFLYNLVALHAMDLFSRYAILELVCVGAWGALAASSITIFGESRCLQIDSGGE